MKLSLRTKQNLGFSLLALLAFGALYSLYSALRSERMLTIAVRQGVESVALKKVAERFSREQRVPVKIQEFSYEDLFKREQEEVSRGRESAFDVILVDDPWMPALMIDLDDRKQGSKEKFRLRKLNEETYSQDDGS